MGSFSKTPQHIAFIMDGNRRWAKQQGKLPHQGHSKGADTAEEVVSWCVEEGIPYITLWALSTDNWQKRSDAELHMIFKLIEHIPARFEKMMQHGVTLKFLGRKEGLPEHIQTSMEKTEQLLFLEHPKHTVFIAINYGGRDELLHAMNEIIKNPPDELTEEHISSLLFTKNLPDVELIVRTGGTKRLSGFMPWQSVYAELFFTDTFWPGFTKEEFTTALAYFDGTQRNFGK